MKCIQCDEDLHKYCCCCGEDAYKIYKKLDYEIKEKIVKINMPMMRCDACDTMEYLMCEADPYLLALEALGEKK